MSDSLVWPYAHVVLLCMLCTTFDFISGIYVFKISVYCFKAYLCTMITVAFVCDNINPLDLV